MSAEQKPDTATTLDDKTLIKWVSILRAQRRLPAVLKAVETQHKGHRMTPARVKRIGKEIEKRLDAGRVPELGELIPIKVKAEIDGRRLLIQLYAEGEKI